MRRVLVLGATGLLGHRVVEVLKPQFDVIGSTTRQSLHDKRFPRDQMACLRFGISAQNFISVHQLIEDVRPLAIINCIGVVKSRINEVSAWEMEEVNARFPWRLAELCHDAKIRLIHISTDCVFSGSAGDYSESDPPDPVDAYGRTKLAGEPRLPGCLVLRTSLIGREYFSKRGLVEWFCSHRNGNVLGFRDAQFSGVTTAVFARLLGRVIDQHPDLEGLWHVAAAKIDKYSLLKQLNTALHLNVEVVPDDTFVCDRSLNGEAFRKMTCFQAPSWPEMVAELAADSGKYE